jgi:hypothetical protein
MSNIRYLPMTFGIVLLVIAFIGSLRGPAQRSDGHDEDDGASPLEMELSDVRAHNRGNLNKLSVGMTKDQAMSAMGTRTFVDEDDDDFLVPNPYRTETYQATDGSVFELLTYYTDLNKSDHKITKDETTPLIFENGKLIGWGWIFVDKLDMRHATDPSAPPAPPPDPPLPPAPPAELPPVEK